MPLISLLLLGSVAALQAPARETAAGVSFARPPEWTRAELANGAVVLAPPGTDADKGTVMLVPSDATALGAAPAHDQAVRAMVGDGRIDGGIERATISAWDRSRFVLVLAQGQRLWTDLYSTVRAGRLATVVFAAVLPTHFDAHRAAVERMMAGATVEPEVGGVASVDAGNRIHGLLIPYPPTWARRDDPAGAVVLVPPQLEGVQHYFLSVLPSSKRVGTHWESHRALVATVLGQVRWTDEPVTRHYPDGPGPFIRTSIAGRVAGGATHQLELYSARRGDSIEAVLGVNGIDRNLTDPVLRLATVAGAVAPLERPRIEEAYRRIDRRQYLNLSGGAPILGTLLYERIWLRADGVADFSTTYPEGYAASPAALKVDAGLLDGDYGRWEGSGNRVRISRSAGSPPLVFDRADGGLIGAGVRWEPMPRVDGLALSGRWSIRSAPDEVSPYYDWIEFDRQGRFRTEGLLRHVATGQADRPEPPRSGSGSYRIEDWTILFRFDDGRTWSSDFSILGRDPDVSDVILFGIRAIRREH
ncbi:MAG: hypothetical protein AB7R55_00395 [Gemmatimonadales bacterium]